MKKILVTGGCGYIGSHTIVELLHKGYEVVSLDNLSNSNEDSLKGIEQIAGKKVVNHNVDLQNIEELQTFFNSNNDFDGVIHFAALKAVGESVTQPLRYYSNNVIGIINLLNCLSLFGIKKFIFSSSCTVYGDVKELPIVETSPFLVTNSPYGRTKQVGEYIIQDLCAQKLIKAISLRYFNPAGAHTSNFIGESSINPALNLVPIITETAIGKRKNFQVYGNDYPTKDGTCIRDYIHIEDLAEAHVLALEYLFYAQQENYFEAFNLGLGRGVSVMEVIQIFENICHVPLKYSIGPRRSGDVAALFADCTKAKTVLNWLPKKTMEEIVQSAWAWEKVRP